MRIGMLISVILWSGVISLCTGCTAILTDSEGIRELSKMQNGLVTTGKSSPDSTDAFWHNHNAETEVKKLRYIQQPEVK